MTRDRWDRRGGKSRRAIRSHDAREFAIGRQDKICCNCKEEQPHFLRPDGTIAKNCKHCNAYYKINGRYPKPKPPRAVVGSVVEFEQDVKDQPLPKLLTGVVVKISKKRKLVIKTEDKHTFYRKRDQVKLIEV